jgi:hypothetical protein
MSMSTSVTLQKTQDVTALPLAKPLDESVWQAWVLKGRAQDERSHAAGMRAAFATVFGALALLYNPVAPVFSFSRQWQSAFVMASAVPFIASLTWRNAKLVPNE